MSASFVVMLLVVATGLLSGALDRSRFRPRSGPAACSASTPSSSPTAAASWTSRPRSPPPGTGARASSCSTCCIGLCWTLILIHPAGLDVVSNTLMMFLMLLVVAVSSMLAASLPIAALAATVPVTAAIALNFALRGTFDDYVLADAGDCRRRLFRAARAPAAFDDAGDAGGARRKGRADRRTRTGQGDLRRGAASAPNPPTSPNRGSSRR